MWLTRILCKQHIPGRIYGGKYRLVKRETPTIRRTKVKNELRLQRNESLLVVPYLTQAQEFEHAWERKQEEQRMFNEAWQKHKTKKLKNVYAFGPLSQGKKENIMEHLNATRTKHE